MKWHALLLAFMMVEGGCTDPGSPKPAAEDPALADVAAELGLSPYLSVYPESVTAEGGIETHVYDPAGPARCLHGTPFKVSIRRGTSPNVLLYLQGGGACWDEETCFTAPLTREFAESFTESSEDEGVFADAEANPFRDWSVVFAPYCDGSLWMGDNDATYGSRVAYHHGMANAAAAVALLAREFKAPGKVVVAGSSAGGFGTLMGYVAARTAMPEAKLYVLNDSGPWRFNEAQAAMVEGIAASWRPFEVSAFTPPACTTCRTELYRIADWAMRQDRATRWGLISFDRDVVIADIYMKFGPAFPTILTETIGFLAERNPGQFQAYVIEGFDHTRLGTNALYDVERNGIPLAAWIGSMLDDREDWVSVP